jgi:hypothetical protein
MKFNKWTLGLVAFAAAVITLTAGCASNYKTTALKEPVKAFAAVTPNGTVIYPIGWQSVTNGTGAVQVLPTFATITTTNPQPFSLAGFFGGGVRRVELFSDAPYEFHRGGGVNVLVDSKYNQLDSQFVESTRFGGTSHLSVGSIELLVSTNGITATGNAGNQLLQGVGSMFGQIANKAVTGKP